MDNIHYTIIIGLLFDRMMSLSGRVDHSKTITGFPGVTLFRVSAQPLFYRAGALFTSTNYITTKVLIFQQGTLS